MVDFNGFDKGVIGRKLPSNSTLNNLRKSDLIELLHIAEHNHTVLAEAYNIAINNSKCKQCPLGKNQEIYNKAIDDYTRKIELKYLGVHPDELYDKYYPREIVKDIKIISEQLKESK